MMDQNQKHKDH